MYQKTTLNNQLTVVTHYMPKRVSVSLGVWIKVGSRYERRQISGISHFLEHLVFKGTKKRSCEQIKQSIEGIGGSLNAFTSEELTCYLAKVPAKFALASLETLSDMVFNARLDSRDLEMERHVILEEIKMYKDLPGHQVVELLTKLLWPNHPLGRNIAGEAESVSSISREQMLNFQQHYYQAQNIVVTACGNIRHNSLLAECKKLFTLSPRAGINRFAKVCIRQTRPQLSLKTKDIEQTHLAIGWHGLPRAHPARFSLGLLHIILGANMSSRLFREVRERRGLAYEISTSLKFLKDTGVFVVHAGIDNRRIIEALEVILNELKEIKKNKIELDELNRAKEYYIGQLKLSLEDTAEHMLWLGENFLSLNKFLYPQEAIARIKKIKAEEVKAWANYILKDSRLNLALIGPLKDRDKNRIKQNLSL